MKYSTIGYILGQVLKFEGIFMLLPFLTGMIYHENEAYSYLIIGIICFVLGCLITLKKVKHPQIFNREGFVAVALSWIVLSIFGAIPFVITGEIPSYVDALFETISGFTTTGASILSNVEALTHTSLMWRSFTHWVGGMGVLVFIMSFLPLMGGSTINLMKAESPGPSVSRLVPHVKDTAKILYRIYLVITIIEIVLLCIFGMPMFDSLTLTFGTVGTGGFGIHNDSIAGYSPVLQNIITVFMILSGVNYVAYFYIMTKQLKEIFKVEEIRVYFGIILGAGTFIALNIRSLYGSLGEAFRHAFFQVGSIITTCGYATTDFDLWPETSKMILVLLMFIGACGGSTGGGFKVQRFVILWKSGFASLRKMVHPNSVNQVKSDDKILRSEVLQHVLSYLILYLGLVIASFLLISLDDMDFGTAVSAVSTCINNIGPGMNRVGPMENFSFLSDFSKMVLSADMLLGRLEIFPILVLLSPSVWRKSF